MRSILIAAAATAGFLSLAPAAFAADTATPTAPAPTSTETAPPTTPGDGDGDDGGHAGVPKAFIAVVPGAAHAGAKVTVRVGCEADSIAKVSSSALQIGKFHEVGPQHDPAKAPVSEASATVLKNVKPGTYRVTFECGGAGISTKFTVVPTAPRTTTPGQVTKVPSGAPQTGGTDGPVGDGGPNATAIALAGAGVVALGGGGFALYRRRRAES